MKSFKFSIVVFLLICFVQGTAQEKNRSEQIKRIKENFSQINSVAQWDSIVRLPFFESTEGGEIAYFYKNAQLKKIITNQFGETFKSITEYYLDNDNLSFIYEKFFRYNRPITWDSTAMKENNDNQVWDIKKSVIKEKRNYFYNNRLIKQIITTPDETRTQLSGLTEEEDRQLQAFHAMILLKDNPNTGN